ncbi:multidrug ABC transporter ATP-binding protein [Tumebacillus algifaecis]|uniref:Multidrug ABC transporter ATP-binding protein n=1 Tax=Tumebacillus algifaecis TaxID=1214604 RepID=A0A223CXT8_9BACL|nr:ABC transporter ATP-binding protein [Tumebacillus algifaecis]ASS74138.1 multidrug ABC transporter ATP-binding protein [Tumebacillus algifaecis]
MLEVTGLTGGYKADVPVIKDVELTVQAGELVGMVGMNGAGKSTVIKHVLGLIEPLAGTVSLHGETLASNRALFRSQIAYVPETPKLYPELTLREHLQLTAMAYGLDEAVYEERSERLLQIFRMKDHLDAFPGTFSKGMQQKVMILCAFLLQPALLIVDEPFVGLDPLAIHALLELLEEMKAQGTGILLSTHILGMAEKYCDRFVMMSRGVVALYGTMDEMRAQSAMPGATLDELFVRVVKESSQ